MIGDHLRAVMIAFGTGTGAAVGSAVGVQFRNTWPSLGMGALVGGAVGAALSWYKTRPTTTGGA
jgi:hypothetical protein